MLQITAPVPPGADGGPLLDRGGNVVGVILSEVNPLHPDSAARDLNFALKASVVRSFLDAAGAGYLTGAPAAVADPAAAEEAARRATVMVECWR
jgi:S1-C subfamily serine protease